MFRKLLIPLFLVTAAAFVVILYMDQEYGRIQQATANEAQLNEDIEKADQVEAKRQDLARKYASFPPDADARLRVLLPQEINPIRLAIDVQNLATQYGLRADKIISDQQSQSNGNAPQNVKSTPIQFEVIATYPQFKIFLEQMEKSLMLREPVMISFKGSDNTDSMSQTDHPIMTYQLGFESYSYDQE